MARSHVSRNSSRQPGRPRKGEAILDRSLIAKAARDIAVEQGVSAVTMRALAAHLGCTPRALYRHVADKSSVLALMADSVLADLPEARRDLPWHESLLEFFTGFRNTLVAHPDAALIIAQQTVAGPNFVRHADRAVGVMLATGFAAETSVEAVVALAYYTLGASVPGTGQPLYDQWRTLDTELSPTDYPHLARVRHLFAHDIAAPRFDSALRRLISDYATSLRTDTSN